MAQLWIDHSDHLLNDDDDNNDDDDDVDDEDNDDDDDYNDISDNDDDDENFATLIESNYMICQIFGVLYSYDTFQYE